MLNEILSNPIIMNIKLANGNICPIVFVVGGNHSRWQPKGSLFHSYYTEM